MFTTDRACSCNLSTIKIAGWLQVIAGGSYEHSYDEEDFLDRTTKIWCNCPIITYDFSLQSVYNPKLIARARASIVRCSYEHFLDRTMILRLKKGKIDRKTLVGVSCDYRKSMTWIKLVVFYPILSFSYTHLKSTTQFEVCCTWDVLLCISGVTCGQNHRTLHNGRGKQQCRSIM